MKSVPRWVICTALPVFCILSNARGALSEIVFPAEAAAVIDMTRPPYNCDNTGREDCTEAIIRALDDTLRPTLEGQRAMEREIAEDPRLDFVHPSSVENRKRDGGWQAIFPARPAPARILYFPHGTYRVSDTLCYTFDDLHNTRGNELSRQIVIMGESEAGTVLRLADHSPGFEAGANRPVLSFIRKERSNVAMMNALAHLTISTGRGNPGAAGLRFFANNTGAVRHVTIRSEDPEHRGTAGLLLDRHNLSGCYFKHLTIDGFNHGVLALPNRINAVFEHLTLSRQRRAGLLVGNLVVSVRGLRSENRVPAVRLTGEAGHLVLVDSTLDQPEGVGDRDWPAIEMDAGVLFARDVRTSGYAHGIGRYGEAVLPSGHIDEFSSHGVQHIAPGQPAHSLRLPVRETPNVPWEKATAQWISVNACGAMGDGETDDTAAIQRALHHGRPVVYFQPGRYLINGPLEVPGAVRRINFMFADLAAGPQLRAREGHGTFIIRDGDAKDPLLLENLFAFEAFRGGQYLVDHASTRTLILRDLHVQTGAVYTNSVSGGDVFIENVACTDQFAPHPNPMTFRGQRVWARQLNPERGFPQVDNIGSDLWVLGFKTEGDGFHNRDGGRIELLGGVANMGDTGFLINAGGEVSVTCSTLGWKPGERMVIVERHPNGERKLPNTRLPRRLLQYSNNPTSFSEQFFLPLFRGVVPAP